MKVWRRKKGFEGIFFFLSHSLLPSPPSSKPLARASGTHGDLSEDLFPFSIVSLPDAPRAAEPVGTTTQFSPSHGSEWCCGAASAGGGKKSHVWHNPAQSHLTAQLSRGHRGGCQRTDTPLQGSFFGVSFLNKGQWFFFFFFYIYFSQSNQKECVESSSRKLSLLTPAPQRTVNWD